jgi:broad specificity phosphatase PhoE
MSELLMVRHGQASFGEKNYDRLSAAGIRQSNLLARHLLSTNQTFDAVYCGTMERQKNTAKELIDCFSGAGIPMPAPVFSADFDEYDSFSVWNSLVKPVINEDPALSGAFTTALTDKKSFQMVFEAVMFRWVSGEHASKGVPSWAGFKQRVISGISKITEAHLSGKKVVVFTSGGPVSAAVQFVLGLSDKKTIELSWQVLNSSVTRFKYSTKGIALSGFNDISHIVMEKEASLITYR